MRDFGGLECRLLKENNIKREQPERREGSEVLHLFDWLGPDWELGC